MVNCPPLAPSSRWFAAFLKNLGNHKDVSKDKDFARFSLIAPDGDKFTLSVPVVGGGRQLRNLNGLELIQISEHGNWRHLWLKSLEALLGKKPFFRELQVSLSPIILDSSLKSLPDFNFAIFQTLFSFLMGNLEVDKLSIFPDNPIWMERGAEIAEKINPDISIIQPLAEFGPEALPGILALN